MGQMQMGGMVINGRLVHLLGSRTLPAPPSAAAMARVYVDDVLDVMPSLLSHVLMDLWGVGCEPLPRRAAAARRHWTLQQLRSAERAALRRAAALMTPSPSPASAHAGGWAHT